MVNEKYIFAITKDDSYDGYYIEMVTTKLKLVFDYASKNDCYVDIFFDGDFDYISRIDLYKTAWYTKGWDIKALDEIKVIKDECLRMQIEKYLNDMINKLNN